MQEFEIIDESKPVYDGLLQLNKSLLSLLSSSSGNTPPAVSKPGQFFFNEKTNQLFQQFYGSKDDWRLVADLNKTSTNKEYVDSVAAKKSPIGHDHDKSYLKLTESAKDALMLGGKKADEYFLKSSISNVVTDSSADTAPSSALFNTLNTRFNALSSSLGKTPEEAMKHLKELIDFIETNSSTLKNLTIDHIAGLTKALDSKMPATTLAKDIDGVSASNGGVFAGSVTVKESDLSRLTVQAGSDDADAVFSLLNSDGKYGYNVKYEGSDKKLYLQSIIDGVIKDYATVDSAGFDINGDLKERGARVYTSQNLPPLSLLKVYSKQEVDDNFLSAKNGKSADSGKLNGQVNSVQSDPNSIAQRDKSGDLIARTVRVELAPMQDTDAVKAKYIIGMNEAGKGSDNSARPISISGLSQLLGLSGKALLTQAQLDAKYLQVIGGRVSGNLLVGNNHNFETNDSVSTYRVDNENGWRLWLAKKGSGESVLEAKMNGDINATNRLLEAGKRVYSPNNPPSAQDVKALPIGGGKVTGNIEASQFQAVNAFGFVARANTDQGMYANPADSRTIIGGGKTNGTIRIRPSGISSTTNETTFHTDGRISLAVQGNADNHLINKSYVDTLLAQKVPTSRKVNGLALTKDITLNASHVNAYDKKQSDDRYQLKSGKVSDSEKLDGLDSTQFVRSDYLAGRAIADSDAADNKGVNFHYISQSAKNKPTGTDHALLTQSFSNAWSTQLASDWRTNRWYVRNQNNGKWGAWAELFSTVNPPKPKDIGALDKGAADGLYLAKGGKAADSSKLNSLSNSATPAANTIAQRDGSGDINVRLVRSNYQDQNTISGGIAYRVSTTDNYVRFCNSNSAVRGWMDVYSKAESDARYPDKGLRGNQRKKITVGGDANTYYPVFIDQGHTDYAWVNWSISRGYSESAPSTWNNSTHKGGLTLSVVASGDTGWGGNSHNYLVNEFSQTYTTMVGGLTLTVSGFVVWLRGGGATYWLNSENGVRAKATVYLNGYTAGDKTVWKAKNKATADADAKSQIEPRYSLRNGAVYDSNNRVYSDGNKPSAATLGVLSLGGGTLTGTLTASKRVVVSGGATIGGNQVTNASLVVDGTMGIDGNEVYSSQDIIVGTLANNILFKKKTTELGRFDGAGLTFSQTERYVTFNAVGGLRAKGARFLHNHNNGNITISAGTTSGDLYLGYRSGSAYVCRNVLVKSPMIADYEIKVQSGKSLILNAPNNTHYSNIRVWEGGNSRGRVLEFSSPDNSSYAFYYQSGGSTGRTMSVNGALEANGMITGKYVGSFAFAEQYKTKAALFENVSTGGTSEFHPLIKQKMTNGSAKYVFSMGTLINSHQWILQYIDDKGKSITYSWDRSGNFTSSGDITAFSDERLKSDIRPIRNALSKVMKIGGYTFYKDGIAGRKAGVIAQEVEKVLPEIVLTQQDEMGTKSVAYGNITALLVEAIKELKMELNELKAQLSA